MKKSTGTKAELIAEIAGLNKKIRKLEKSEAGRQKAETTPHHEERYRTLLDNLEEGYFEVDLAGNFTFFNDNLRRAMGYSNKELTGMNYRQSMDKEEAKRVFQAYNKIYKTGKPNRKFGWTITRKDGKKRYIEGAVSLLKDASGKPTGFRGIAHDHTGYREIEEKLRFEEQRFRTFVEHSSDITLIINLEGIITYINPAVEKALGFKPEKRIGAKASERIHPDDMEFVRNSLGTLARDVNAPVITGEIRLQHKDGTWRTFEAVGRNLISNNVVESIIINYHDITERKRAEELLKQSETQYRFLADHMRDTVWLVDMNLKTVYNSPSVQRMRGYSQAEIEALPLEKQITPACIEQVMQAFAEEMPKILADPAYEVERTLELEFYRKDGTTYWSESTFSLIRDESGKPLYFLSEGRDITERKRVEAALQESEERYKSLFENAHEAIFVAQEGKLVFLNKMTATQIGYSVRELESKSFLDLIHPDDQEMVINSHIKRMKGEEVPNIYVFRVMHKNGSVMWTELNAVMINWKGKPATLNFMTDITERKRAADKLRESEERFINLVEQSPLSIQILDTSGKTLKVNKAFEELWGVAFEQMRDYNILEDEQFDKIGIREHLKKVFSGESLSFPPAEFTPQTGSFVGRRRVVQATAYPIRDKSGTIQSVTMIHQDITDRKQAEEALRLKNLVFDTSLAANSIADSEGIITEANDAFLQMWGYPGKDEVVGRSISYFFNDPDEAAAIVTAILRHGEWQGDFTAKKKDGATFYAHFMATVIRDANGQVTGYQSSIMDFTERKRIEDELRLSEERLRLLVKNSSDIIAIVDPDGQQRYVSDAAEAITGFSARELASKNISDVIHPDDFTGVIEAFIVCLEHPDRIMRAEYRHIHRTKGWVYVEAVAQNFLDDPSVRGIITNVRNISDRHQAEEEKQMLQDRLKQMDKIEAIGTLAGGIAHNFNNMLMGIQAYASLALLETEPSHRNYERLKRIEEQVQKGADLTTQLLGFARGGRYEVKPADMNEILEKTSSMFGIAKKEIAIHKKYGKDLWNVEADKGQMEQVFLNLYVNAWQAMPGGGDLYLSTQNVDLSRERAHYFSVNPGKYVKITVTDTGVGIDEKTKERIFDPFFTTKEIGRGTGLGLATVYGIIKGHKGMINVYSQPGHGTTFSIYLPASEKNITEEETEAEKFVRGAETILLVDDEKMVLDVNQEMLTSIGYKVYAVDNCQEAIAVYTEKRNEIDLVVLDMIMPGLSGAETFDRLRQINPDVKVLLSSGYSLNGEAQSIMSRGCNGFIQKPFHLEQLSKKIREILHESSISPH